MLRALRAFERSRPFTESEAWVLFRLAAFGEAFGWTALIIGVVIKRYLTDGNEAGVAVGGRIHGMLFITYLAACVVLYPSLGWSRWRAIVGLMFSTPPYGSLVFEQWAARRRKANGFKSYRHYMLYRLIVTEKR